MAVDIFLKLSNNIDGESEDAVHGSAQGDYGRGIDVLAWNWGMTQSGTTHMGTGSGGGKVSVMDLSITKYVDKSSDNLIKKCMDGTHIEKGILIVRKAGGTPLEYFKVVMENIIVSSYHTGGSKDGLDRVQENLTLNLRKVECRYTEQDTTTGGAGPESMAGWDIAKNEAWTA
jgi:type VI secretion system secreted protein Hcp